jgi:NADH dehydrogenase FAD-containing subunit
MPIERIVVCGGGLAAHMTAAALARQLPPTIQIIDAALAAWLDRHERQLKGR